MDLDENNNAVQGDAVRLYESSNNIINVPNDKLVVLQGLNGYIVVTKMKEHYLSVKKRKSNK